MQQAQKAAAEAEAQRDGVFRLETERAVVEAELFQRIAQHPMLMRFHWIQPSEHHWFQRFESRQRLGGRISMIHYGVADLGVGHGFDVREKEAHLARRELFAGGGLGRLVPDALHFINRVGRPQADLLSLAQPALDHARQDDHAAIGIEPGIEDERA